MVIVITMLMMVTGCYTQQHARRQIIKAEAHYPEILSGICGDLYPPIEWVNDSFIYLPGIPVVNTDTAYDTVRSIVFKYINRYITRRDTIYKTRNVQLVNRAAEAALSSENNKLSQTLAGKAKEVQILYWVAGVLGIYTVLRWVLRYWGIRLP